MVKKPYPCCGCGCTPCSDYYSNTWNFAFSNWTDQLVGYANAVASGHTGGGANCWYYWGSGLGSFINGGAGSFTLSGADLVIDSSSLEHHAKRVDLGLTDLDLTLHISPGLSFTKPASGTFTTVYTINFAYWKSLLRLFERIPPGGTCRQRFLSGFLHSEVTSADVTLSTGYTTTFPSEGTDGGFGITTFRGDNVDNCAIPLLANSDTFGFFLQVDNGASGLWQMNYPLLGPSSTLLTVDY